MGGVKGAGKRVSGGHVPPVRSYDSVSIKPRDA